MDIKNSRIVHFINSIKIKHDDIPDIIIELAIIFGACLVGWLLAELTGLLIAAILGGSLIIISLLYHLFRANENFHIYQQQKFQDLLTLFNKIDFRYPLPYLTNFAASPELARIIFTTVLENKPELTVELGSGVSSVITGYAFEQNGKGRLISIDHKKKYVRHTRELLQNHKLSNFVHLVHCPLKQQKINNAQRIWYDVSNIEFEQPIDLLTIDGPPEQTRPQARYPALPALYPYLSDKAVIIMDDAKRTDCKKTVEDWLNEYNDLSYHLVDTDRGIGIIKRNKEKLS